MGRGANTTARPRLLMGRAMTDTEELNIEAVTQYKPAADPYTSAIAKTFGGGARLIPISLAKVRWLDRPEVDGQAKTDCEAAQ